MLGYGPVKPDRLKGEMMAVAELSAPPLSDALGLNDASFDAGKVSVTFKVTIVPGPPPEPRPLTGLERESDARVAELALEVVNLIREESGLGRIEALPPGVRGKSDDCVLARALHTDAQRVEVGANGLSISGVFRPCPPSFREFFRRFDSGRYPDLVSSFFSGELIGS